MALAGGTPHIMITATFPAAALHGHSMPLVSKSAMDTLTAAIRSELVMAGIPVSVTTLLLGLIATDANVNKGGARCWSRWCCPGSACGVDHCAMWHEHVSSCFADALASQAMPVADCAAEMVCALDSRESVAYVLCD